MDVSGDRRSCAISTTSSSPVGPLRQEARFSGSRSGCRVAGDRAGSETGRASHSSVMAVLAVISRPTGAGHGGYAGLGEFGVHWRRADFALDDPAGGGAALEPVPLHHPVQRGAVNTGDPRGL